MRMTVGLLLRCNHAEGSISQLLVIGNIPRGVFCERANLCDQHKFCASRSVLLGTEWTVISREQQAKRFKNFLCF